MKLKSKCLMSVLVAIALLPSTSFAWSWAEEVGAAYDCTLTPADFNTTFNQTVTVPLGNGKTATAMISAEAGYDGDGVLVRWTQPTLPTGFADPNADYFAGSWHGVLNIKVLDNTLFWTEETGYFVRYNTMVNPALRNTCQNMKLDLVRRAAAQFYN